MKYLIFLTIFFASCTLQKKITLKEIKSVHVLFSSPSWGNQSGYKLNNGETVKWDTRNIEVKRALDRYSSNIDSLQYKSSLYAEKLLKDKNKVDRYVPFKVVPLREFGYLKTASGKLIYYGIMGENTFIDLSSNQVYY